MDQEGRVEYSKGVQLELVLQICGDHFSHQGGLSWLSWLSWRGFGVLAIWVKAVSTIDLGVLRGRSRIFRRGEVKVLQTIFFFGILIIVLGCLDKTKKRNHIIVVKIPCTC